MVLSALLFSGCIINPTEEKSEEAHAQASKCMPAHTESVFTEACSQAAERFDRESLMATETDLQEHYARLANLFAMKALKPVKFVAISAQLHLDSSCSDFTRNFGSLSRGRAIMKAILVAVELPHVPLTIRLAAASAFARMAHSTFRPPSLIVDRFLMLLERLEAPLDARDSESVQLSFENIRAYITLRGR